MTSMTMAVGLGEGSFFETRERGTEVVVDTAMVTLLENGWGRVGVGID
jgi:hypothetical protein